MTELDIQHLPEWKKYRDDLKAIIGRDGDPDDYLNNRIKALDRLISNAESMKNS